MQAIDLKHAIRTHGRVKFTPQDELILDWFYTGFTVDFDGSKFEIHVKGDKFDSFPLYSGLEIDDQQLEMILVDKNDFVLTRELAKGVHRVTFRRMTEVVENQDFFVTKVLIDGELTKKKYEFHRQICFVGDCTFVGRGVNGKKGQSGELVVKEEDPRLAIPYSLMQKFNAEGRVISYSDAGIYCNAQGSTTHQVNDWYHRRLPWRKLDNLHDDHDFNSWSPDCVVIGLGTNDSLGKAPFEQLREHVLKFVKFLRSKHPVEPIFWVYGLMENGYTDVFNKILDEVNDPNIIRVFFDGLRDGEEGAGGHPNAKGYERFNKAIADKISEVLRWQ